MKLKHQADNTKCWFSNHSEGKGATVSKLIEVIRKTCSSVCRYTEEATERDRHERRWLTEECGILIEPQRSELNAKGETLMFKQKSVLILVLAYAAVSLLVYTFSPAEYALASNGIVVPGAPIRGVDVKLGSNPPGNAGARATKSEENGSFTFSDVAAGSYDLTLTLPETKQDSSSKSKTVPISISLTGVDGGKMTKDLDFVQEAPNSTARAGKAKFKNIVLRIQVSASGPVSGIITERASALRLDEKMNKEN